MNNFKSNAEEILEFQKDFKSNPVGISEFSELFQDNLREILEFPENLKKIPKNPSDFKKFAMRYLIIESKEPLNSSWCSNPKNEVLVQSKPVLQYTVDGINWCNIPTVIITENEDAI